MKHQFPKDFWWGAAASGPQTEGRLPNDSKGSSIWDHWYQTNPEKFFQGQGPDRTTQAITHFQEDLNSMEEIGFNSFRTSIQWSRLMPEGRGAVDQAAGCGYAGIASTNQSSFSL